MSASRNTRPPCRCERLPFPHRHAWQCDAFEDGSLDDGGPYYSADRDIYSADCRERARDMNLAARGL